MRLIFFSILLGFAPDLLANTEVLFSPNGGCENKVIQLLDASKTKVDIAIYSLNNTSILKALSRAKLRGVSIRVLLDRIQVGGLANRNAALALKKEGVDVRIHSKNRIQHNKFAIFDDEKIITGSFNWTNSAEHANEENCLTVDDASTVKEFNKRFEQHLWSVNTQEKSLIMLESLKTKN